MSAVVIENKSKIDVQDVRQFMMDRTVKDNLLDMDLAYSDEDIGFARRFAAMEYNESPPLCHRVCVDNLPFGLTFLWGIAYYLIVGNLQKLMRQDIDYSAGNVAVDLTKRRIEHLKTLLPVYKGEFEKRVLQQKAQINIAAGYRAY